MEPLTISCGAFIKCCSQIQSRFYSAALTWPLFEDNKTSLYIHLEAEFALDVTFYIDYQLTFKLQLSLSTFYT